MENILVNKKSVRLAPAMGVVNRRRPEFLRSAAPAAISVLLLVACGSAPRPAEPVARGDMTALTRQLEAFIADELASNEVMGLSIALVDDQRMLWAYGAGWADAATRRPAGPDTLYRMGSISKLFTDTAAMQAVARQQLSLDAPIQRALPTFRIQTRWGDAPITPRQLMTHHSGLPRDMLGGMWGTPVGDFRSMVSNLYTEHASAPPGQVLDYSNLGVTVLGAAIEQLSGTPFEAHLQSSLLAPLGMDGASFSAAVPNSPAMARAYLKRELQQEPALRDVPAGGLTASVTDMAKFIAMQFAQGRNARGEVVLPQAQWAEMLQVQNADVPLDVGFQVGLGWMLSTFGSDTVHGGGSVAHHGGATFFYRSQLMMMPEQRLGVVVAANDGAGGGVVNRVAQRALALMLEAKTGLRQPPRVPGFVPTQVPWSDAALQSCVGDFVTPVGGVTVSSNGRRLHARVDGKTLELLEGEQGTLGMSYKLGGLIALPLGELSAVGIRCPTIDGRAVLVAQLDGQSALVGAKLPSVPGDTLPPEWIALAGRYEPLLAPGERATVEQVTVGADRGRLWVEPTIAAAFGGERPLRMPLQLLSDTQALLVGPLADSGPVITLQRAADGRHRLLYSGMLFVRVQR